MDAVLEQLRIEGYALKPEDVARLSPLTFDHINFLCRYAFALPDSVAHGQFAPSPESRHSRGRIAVNPKPVFCSVAPQTPI